MTTTRRLRASTVTGFGHPARLNPADAALKPQAAVSAGPFSVEASVHATPNAANALLTALMIVYPAFATVAVVALGLLLSGTSL